MTMSLDWGRQARMLPQPSIADVPCRGPDTAGCLQAESRMMSDHMRAPRQYRRLHDGKIEYDPETGLPKNVDQ